MCFIHTVSVHGAVLNEHDRPLEANGASPEVVEVRQGRKLISVVNPAPQVIGPRRAPMCSLARRLAAVALVAFALLLPGAPALAQVDTGTILGTVKDGSGAVVAGAKVTLTHEAQAFTLSRPTRPNGTYIFTPIRIGTYRVEVESQGFKKAVRRGIELNLQQQAVVDVALETGQLEEAVDGMAEVPLLQTRSGEGGDTITAVTIENLPLNGRDYTA